MPAELNCADLEMFMCEAGWAQIDHRGEYDELRWVVAPHLRNRGYGKRIAELLRAQTKKPIMATIKRDNIPSLKIARHIGCEIRIIE